MLAAVNIHHKKLKWWWMKPEIQNWILKRSVEILEVVVSFSQRSGTNALKDYTEGE